MDKLYTYCKILATFALWCGIISQQRSKTDCNIAVPISKIFDGNDTAIGVVKHFNFTDDPVAI